MGALSSKRTALNPSEMAALPPRLGRAVGVNAVGVNSVGVIAQSSVRSPGKGISARLAESCSNDVGWAK